MNNEFSEDYEPTVLDLYSGTKNIKKKQIEIEIHDTSGDASLAVNRKVQYQKADVFIICVAVNSRESCDNVPKWAAEIRSVVPDAAIVICLTKKDLLDYTDEPVTEDMIKA